MLPNYRIPCEPCDYCGNKTSCHGRCTCCGFGIHFNLKTSREGMEGLSLDDGGAAEKQAKLDRENPWDSSAEADITELYRPKNHDDY